MRPEGVVYQTRGRGYRVSESKGLHAADQNKYCTTIIAISSRNIAIDDHDRHSQYSHDRHNVTPYRGEGYSPEPGIFDFHKGHG